MGKSGIALVMLATLTGCRDSSGVPVSAGGVQVGVGGITMRARLFLTGFDRSRVPDALRGLGPREAALVGYSRERHIHLYGNIPVADFDVAFLDSSGLIVDIGEVRQDSPEGATSTRPAQYALLLALGWLRERGVIAGNAVSLPENLGEPEPLPVLKIGERTIHVEAAVDPNDRSRGLMYRRNLSWEDGMLFMYPEEGPRSFWMRNTFVPLDVAFLATDGRIHNVVETPVWDDPEFGEGPHPESDAPSRYVLEVNLGWFRRNGLLDASGKIRKGIRVEIPDEIR